MTTPVGGLERAERVYRFLLGVLPRRFRAEAEEEMVEVFRDSYRVAMNRSTILAWPAFWIRNILDLIIAASPVSGQLTSRRAGGRGSGGGEIMGGFVSEIAYAVRTLGRRKGFTTIVVLTFGLGVGASTTVFTGFQHVLLQPLPFPEPDELVQVWETRRDRPEFPFSIPDYESLGVRAASFVDEAAYMFGDFSSVTLTGSDRPERIRGAYVTPSLFSVLGVQPAVGRSFSPQESEPDNARVVLLSHQEWTDRFGSDAQILGRVLNLNGSPHEVVGVMPEGFGFPVGSEARLWRPLPLLDSWRNNRGNHLIQVVARMKPGIELQTAVDEVAALGASLASEFPETNADSGMRVTGLHDQVVGDVRQALFALMGAVLLLWLVATVNVASLGVARALDRQREMSVRVAHGASGFRIARLVVAESAVAGIVGAGLGVVLAVFGVGLLASWGPSSIPRLADIQVGGTSIAFALTLTVVTSLIAGLLPVVMLAHSRGVSSLAVGSARMSPGRMGRRTRGALVSTEFALALVLLIGSGLLFQSFVNLSRVDPGFRTEGLLTAEMNLASARYPDSESRIQHYDRLLPVLEALPGVTAVGAISVFPLSGNPGGGTSLHREGASEREGFASSVRFRVPTPNYFDVAEIPILAGRTVSAEDSREHPVAVVNETLAGILWPGEDPIGRVMFSGRPDTPGRSYEVVGLVGDVKGFTLGVPAEPHVYVPYAQFSMQEMVLVLRTAGPPEAMATALRRAVLSVDPDQPLEAVQSAEQIVSGSVAQPRFNLLLLALFTVSAVSLSAIGIYGVMTESVKARTKEIGIRMALGAGGVSVVRMTLRQGMLQTAIGLVVGCVLAVFGTELLASMVFGIAPRDVRTFLLGALVLAVVALIGSVAPAIGASRIDPVRALSSD